MSKRIRRRGGGTLHIVAGLLLASAVVRLVAEAGPALADEGAVVDEGAELAKEEMVVADDLLTAFKARENRLIEREAQLRDRMQALRVAEVEIQEKLDALIAAEASLSATIALAESASETDLARLTTVYENMKPKEAAALFEEMSPPFAAGFLGMMRPDAAAAIMTLLEPETAYSFSVVLAGRNANTPTE